MLAYTFVSKDNFSLIKKPIPEIVNPSDAIVKVTLASICTSDLHIKHGFVPRAVPGITLGHEMVGIVEKVGEEVKNVRPGDRVSVNVETYCGKCFFCQHGFVNNCKDPNGGWALGCRIDGGQAEYVRVPFADQGLTIIPDNVSDRSALFVGDLLSTGDWAARISEIQEDDTILIIGAGPTGVCTLASVILYPHKSVIVCEIDDKRRDFIKKHYPGVIVTSPSELKKCIRDNTDRGGCDKVIEVAGSSETFQMAWESARPNAIVTIVAMYDNPQILPLPQMYGKNLIFKTGGVDGCHCKEVLDKISQGLLDTTTLISHTFKLNEIEKAYELFQSHNDDVIKIAIEIN